MASSQIRQFASLIDQLPCDVEDLNLIDNFEVYNKCFGNTINNDNTKGSDSFFSYNSNITNYLNNLSNCQFQFKRMQNTDEKTYSNYSINEQGNPMLLDRPHLNKNNENDDHDKNMSLSDLINIQSNPCNNNDVYRNISTKISFHSKYTNDNIDINNNFNNSLFIHSNDLTDQHKNNFIEKLKSPIILTNNKSINKNSKNKKKTLLKNNISYNNDDEKNNFLENDQIVNNNKQNDTYSQYNIKHPFNDNLPPSHEYNNLQQYDNHMFNSNCVNGINNIYTNGQKINNSNQIFNGYNNMTYSGESNNAKSVNGLMINNKLGSKLETLNFPSGQNLSNNFMSNKKEMNTFNDVIPNVQMNSQGNIPYDFYDILERNHELSKHILLSKKPKVIKLESNKSLIIFPVSIHEHGNKYIAVNQEDLLEYISSSIEIENEDISSLRIGIHQKEKELQNMKAAYGMQTTNIHYLINRVIFKECEYEKLKNKNISLENEMKKLIHEMNYLISQSKDGLFMQKVFIDHKSKCVLKLQELKPFLGSYYEDIFNYITSCRTLGQLSIWLPAFQITDPSLETVAKHLIKILLNGLGSPFNICSEYFLSNQNCNTNNNNNNISLETEGDFFKKNLEKKKIIENYIITNMNSINTNKENNYNLSNCQSISLNSESSSFMEAEELFFNSSKYPSMHSVILRNTKEQKKKEKIMNQLNRSNTTPEGLYTNNHLFTYSDKIINEDKTEFTNSQDFINSVIDEQHFKKKKSDNKNMIKTKQNTSYNNKRNNSNTQNKENKKIKKNKNVNYNNNMSIKTNDESNTFMKTKQYLEGSKINELLRANETLIENEIETNIYKEKGGDKMDLSHFINVNENEVDLSHYINVNDNESDLSHYINVKELKLHIKDDNTIKSNNNQFDQISNNITEQEEKKNITSKEKQTNKNKKNEILNRSNEQLDETQYKNKMKSKDIHNIINQQDTEKSISRGCSLKGSMEHISDKNILTEYEKTASQNDIEQIELLRNKTIEDETLEKGKMCDEHLIMLKKDEKIYKNKKDQELFSLKNKPSEEKQKQNEYSTDNNNNNTEILRMNNQMNFKKMDTIMENKSKELNEEEQNKK